MWGFNDEDKPYHVQLYNIIKKCLGYEICIDLKRICFPHGGKTKCSKTPFKYMEGKLYKAIS